jgi:hypothetical protein
MKLCVVFFSVRTLTAKKGNHQHNKSQQNKYPNKKKRKLKLIHSVL